MHSLQCRQVPDAGIWRHRDWVVHRGECLGSMMAADDQALCSGILTICVHGQCIAGSYSSSNSTSCTSVSSPALADGIRPENAFHYPAVCDFERDRSVSCACMFVVPGCLSKGHMPLDAW
jgi:hypothetical protein